MEYAKRLWDFLIELLLPEAARVKRLARMSPSELRRILPKAERATDRLTYALFDYRNKDVRALISAIKYKKHPKLLETVAILLHEEILSLLEDQMIFEHKTEIALIPIPMKKADERTRGYNQSLELCRSVSRLDSNIKIASILAKTKETKHQRNLSREERLKNLHYSMQAEKLLLPKTTLPILIDDVTTTGATFAEARRALGEMGLENILAVALAH